MVAVALVTVGLLAAASAGAQSVDFFDGFDSNVIGWTSFDPAVAIRWDGEVDRTDPATSGAAHVVNSRATPDNRPIEYGFACFPIDPALDYEIGGSIWIPPGSDGAVAQLSAVWYRTGSCTGILGFGGSWDVRIPGDDWIDVADVLRPPITASSARLGLMVFRLGPADSVEVYFDDVYFAPEPEAALVALLSLLALRAARGASRLTRVGPGSWPAPRSATGASRRPAPRR